MPLGEHVRGSHQRDRRTQFVVPAGHNVALAAHHRLETLLGDLGGMSFLLCPILVSSMSARSKKSVSVAPGIRQVTVTPEPLSSWRSANENESRNAFVPL